MTLRPRLTTSLPFSQRIGMRRGIFGIVGQQQLNRKRVSGTPTRRTEQAANEFVGGGRVTSLAAPKASAVKEAARAQAESLARRITPRSS